MRVVRMAGAALGGGLLITGLGAAPVAASPARWEPGHVEWGDITEDTCDIAGLTVQDDGSSQWRSRTQLRDGLPYEQSISVTTDVYTNVATGESASIVEKGTQTTLDVTDNGDGTLTIVYLFTGTRNAYDGQGAVIGHSAGSVTVESVWDHAGTISDRNDDTPLSFTLLRNSGTELDFCEDVVPAIT